MNPQLFLCIRRPGARHAHVATRARRTRSAAATGMSSRRGSREQTEQGSSDPCRAHGMDALPLPPVQHGVSTRDSHIPLSGRTPNASGTDCQDGAFKTCWLCDSATGVGRRKSPARRSKATGSRQAGGRHSSRMLEVRDNSAAPVLALRSRQQSPSDHTHARRHARHSGMRAQRVRLPWRRRGASEEKETGRGAHRSCRGS